MKAQFTVAALFGLLSAASAQKVVCQDAAEKIPNCARNCMFDAQKSIGCDTLDFACGCTKQEALQTAAEACVIASCGHDEALKVLSAGQDLCTCVAAAAAVPSAAPVHSEEYHPTSVEAPYVTPTEPAYTPTEPAYTPTEPAYTHTEADYYHSEPGYYHSEPGYYHSEPAYTAPAYTEPAYSAPAYTEPAYSAPAYTDEYGHEYAPQSEVPHYYGGETQTAPVYPDVTPYPEYPEDHACYGIPVVTVTVTADESYYAA